MSFDFSCDWKSGFLMDPLNKQRCGYLMAFDGMGIPDASKLKAEDAGVKVFLPYNGADGPQASPMKEAVSSEGSPKTVDCLGIIESLSYGGGVGDPICISAYVSSKFATTLLTLQQQTLKTTAVKALSWWIGNYDVEKKEWYEESNPLGVTGASDGIIKGQLNSGGSEVRLSIAKEPTMISPTLDIQVFNLYFEVVPASDETYALSFRNGATEAFVKGWGLRVGTEAKTKMAA